MKGRFYWNKRTEEALKKSIEYFRQAIEKDPDYALAYAGLADSYSLLGLAYEQKTMYEEAIVEFQKATTLSGNGPSMIASLGHGYAVSGNRSEAQRVLEELKQLSGKRYVSPYNLASVYAGLADEERALEWLQKAYEERSRPMVYLKVDPAFDSLHSHPKFQDLLQRIAPPPLRQDIF